MSLRTPDPLSASRGRGLGTRLVCTILRVWEQDCVVLCCAGCGNGKYLGVNPRTYKLGSDICSELVTIAASRGHEVAVCDCLNLPYRSNQFDAAICVAVIHHLSTEERRVAALRELIRIVRPGGEALVYVWAMEQEKKKVRK